MQCAVKLAVATTSIYDVKRTQHEESSSALQGNRPPNYRSPNTRPRCKYRYIEFTSRADQANDANSYPPPRPGAEKQLRPSFCKVQLAKHGMLPARYPPLMTSAGSPNQRNNARQQREQTPRSNPAAGWI